MGSQMSRVKVSTGAVQCHRSYLTIPSIVTCPDNINSTSMAILVVLHALCPAEGQTAFATNRVVSGTATDCLLSLTSPDSLRV